MGRCRKALAVLLPLALAACGPPTLDPDDFDASAERLRESVDEDERPHLYDALRLVEQARRGEVAGTEAFSVDGMTAADVLAEGRRIELRREKAWIEEELAGRRAVLAESEELAKLGPTEVAANADGVVTFKVRNGLGVPISTGWVRTTVELAEGPVESEDFVDFGGVLRPGEERALTLEVTGEARRHLPPPREARLSAAFTMVEHGGAIVAKEPSAEEKSRAETAIEDAEHELAEVERQLAEVQ